MKKALITGITGQDGSYLAELLLGKGYDVHGIVRRVAIEDPAHRVCRIQGILDRIHLHSASLDSYASLFSIVEAVQPDECYHLAAQSFVGYSFDDEFSTLQTNIQGTHYMLSALRHKSPGCKFYFAASSEMFGNAEESPQNERTPFHPRSSYGISKVAGFHLTENYRQTHEMFACNGILFNHESERRGFEFVTRKISSGVARIKLGLADRLELGNLDARRDWGYAPEYIRAMWLMLQQDEPGDFAVGTGETHTVREFVARAFDVVGLNWEDHVVLNQAFYRPADVNVLQADASKARAVLKWAPKVNLDRLVEIMVENDIKRHRGEKHLAKSPMEPSVSSIGGDRLA
jgi:GDPmannose 4,6-dehydratase